MIIITDGPSFIPSSFQQDREDGESDQDIGHMDDDCPIVVSGDIIIIIKI